jgi:hypothetical protein
MALIVNLHRKDTPNRGDVAAAPGLYLDWPGHEIRVAEITGWKYKEEARRDHWLDLVSRADMVIVGGGGLLEFDKHRDSMEFVAALNAKKVIWGAGYNGSPDLSWLKMRPTFSADYSHFDLVGVRDAGHDLEWVPCASCLSPAFDAVRDVAVETEFAFFANMAVPSLKEYLPEGVDPSLVVSNFKTPLIDILTTFAKAETVVTTSYHGAFWGTLLGRKVVAIPTNAKFYGLKHPVPLADRSDWRRFVPLSRTYPDALAECRAVTNAFADRALALLA